MRKGLLCAFVVPVFVVTGSYAQSPAAVAPAPVVETSQIKFDDLCGCNTCPAASSWIKADYLAWWTKKGPIPNPALTSGTPASRGIVGDPETTYLYAPGGLDYEIQQGGRLTWGTWLDGCHSWGVEVSGFVLEKSSTNFSIVSDFIGDPTIASPYFDATTGASTSYVIANRSELTGDAVISSRQHFWGLEANVLRNVWTSCNSRLDFIVGYRQLGLAESLHQSSASRLLTDGAAGFLGETLATGEIIVIRDDIKTNNHFYGGQVGARYTHTWGNLDLALAGTIALGVNHESFQLYGDTAAVRLDGSVGYSPLGGLYVQPSNAGLTQKNSFSYVPELRADATYRLTERLSVGVGYTFIYWSKVARPGDQIDPILDPQQIASNLQYNPAAVVTSPARRDAESSFWAQGLSLQIGFRY